MQNLLCSLIEAHKFALHCSDFKKKCEEIMVQWVKTLTDLAEATRPHKELGRDLNLAVSES